MGRPNKQEVLNFLKGVTHVYHIDINYKIRSEEPIKIDPESLHIFVGDWWIDSADGKDSACIWKEEVGFTEVKRETITTNNTMKLSRENYKKIYDIACGEWKQKLQTWFAQDFAIEDEIELKESLYIQMRKACTPEQNKLFNKIFGEYTPEYSKLKMKVGKWYEEKTERCLIQYLGNNRVLGLFRTYSEFDTWDWKNDGESYLKQLTPEEACEKMNTYKTNKK